MITYRKIEPDLFEFSIDGTITKADIEDVWSRFSPDVPAEGKIRVLEIIGHIDGMTPSAVWEDFKRGWPFISRVSRVAIVTDQRWVSIFVKAASVLIASQMKVFAPGDVEAARRWLEG